MRGCWEGGVHVMSLAAGPLTPVPCLPGEVEVVKGGRGVGVLTTYDLEDQLSLCITTRWLGAGAGVVVGLFARQVASQRLQLRCLCLVIWLTV